MKRFPIHYQIFLALVLGALLGWVWPDATAYTHWMGQLFMRALRMVVVPLVLGSVVSGVANLGSSGQLGRLGLKTMVYYLSTTLLAILTGLALVNGLQPGHGADLSQREQIDNLPAASASFAELLLSIVPTNIFRSLAEADMLGIIFFSIVLGYSITTLPAEPRGRLTAAFDAFFQAMMQLTGYVIRLAPFGVFGMLASTVANNAHRLSSLAGSLGLYMVVVLLGLAIHFFVGLPSLMFLISKAHPYRHMRNMRTALLTAFSTASSGATLALTLEAVEHQSGVSNRVASFTLPLGATINMDGTALYELVAVFFIAQAYGIDLTWSQQLVVVFTALLASVGAAAIPMAGLVMMTIVLAAVQLPTEGIGLILAVDRILDMFRTATNVWSDACGAVVIARSEGEQTKV